MNVETRLDQRADRIRNHSSQEVNARIALLTQARAEHAASQGRDAIVQRLTELDREWDVDRVLMANFAVAGGAAYAFGLQRYSDRFWGDRPKGLLALLGVQIGFMMLHASVGWCPPMALWRRLGFRSKVEIDMERTLLLEALDSAKRVDAAHRLPPAAAGLASADAPINQ
jgi:hypothetical protein